MLKVIQRQLGPVQWSAEPTQDGGTALHIAVTASAFKAALESAQASPLIATFLSSEQYGSVTRAAPSRLAPGRPITALFAEAAPLHQMQLIARIYQRRVKVGALLTHASSHVEPLLRDAARATDLDLQVEHVEPDTDILRAVLRVSSATVLLAIPDSNLFTAARLRDILESTYRRGQPMIGFSTAMVHAGAMATAYSSIDDTVAHLEEVVRDVETGRMPHPQYPKYWRVTINENVARSLNIPIDESVKGTGNLPAGRSK